MCWENKNTWIFPYENIKHLTKISIGTGESKYLSYEIKESDNLIEIMNNYYKNMKKYTFDVLDTPKNICQQKEKIFHDLRESKITFIKFINNNIEGLVYDFKINDKKIQEKVGSTQANKNGISFTLNKNNGVINGVRKLKNYDINDNDYYWLNCPNKKHFYVFPQQILIDYKYIGQDKQKGLYLNPANTDYWYSEYMFDYENINKKKLLNLLQIKEVKHTEEENIENLVAKLTIS
jgi:hypothetical protein